MVSTLIAAMKKRRGATPHPAKYFKNTCRGVFSANEGKEHKENLPRSVCALWQAEAFLCQPGGGEENVYMIAVLSFNFYQRNGELIALPVYAPHHWFKVFRGLS